MSGVHDARMEEDAEMIAELADIYSGLTDYLDPDDEMTPRLKAAIEKLRDQYFERYGEKPKPIDPGITFFDDDDDPYGFEVQEGEIGS